MKEENKTLELWTELKTVVEEIDEQVYKNAERHNISAGIRVRKGMRVLRKLCQVLAKTSLEADGSVLKERAAKRAESGVPKRTPPTRSKSS